MKTEEKTVDYSDISDNTDMSDDYPYHGESCCPYADLYAGQENEQEMCHEYPEISKISK